MPRGMRTYYTREHPIWPSNENEALDEISELNDLLDRGGWSKGQRDWIYNRRRKLVRYVREPAYRSHTGGVNKAQETMAINRDKAVQDSHVEGCMCGACVAMRNRQEERKSSVNE